jgi:LTXXQ motif family protein
VKIHHPFITRGVTAVALAVSLALASAPVMSQPESRGGPVTAEEQAARQARMQERMQAHLTEMAKRLQINAAQQEAWTAYANTVQSTFGDRAAKPAADADAATIVRFRAERAARHAQKLTQLADATARLQDALSPEQRKTLDEIVRSRGGSHHGHHHGK